MHEADRERLGGADHPAGHDQLLRARVADGAHEPRRPADVGDEPDAHLGQAELAVGGGDPEVAGERQLEARARARSGACAAITGFSIASRRDERRLHVARPALRNGPRASPRTSPASIVKSTPAENTRPLAVEHDGAHVAVALGGRDRVDQLGEQLAVEGVPLLGTVQADVEERRPPAGVTIRGAGMGHYPTGRAAPPQSRRARRTAISAPRMRRPSCCVLTLVAALADRASGAAPSLYATAATPGRVDGFCVAGDGRRSPVRERQCGRRRGLAAPSVLVAERTSSTSARSTASRRTDRPARGPQAGSTEPTKPVMNVATMALSPDGKCSTSRENGVGRIAAYPLDAGRRLADGAFTSCIQGDRAGPHARRSRYVGLLYLTAAPPGRVAMFALNPDGSLPRALLRPIATRRAARGPTHRRASERTKLGNLRCSWS